MTEAKAEFRSDDDLLRRIREALAANPGGVLEEVARREGATYRDVLHALPEGQSAAAPGEAFGTVWASLAVWPGEVTFIVHTQDGVFETRGSVPPGSYGRGYFNVHGNSPIGGHIRTDRCAAIYFVDRPFLGRRSCSVQFINQDGAAMFKVFVGRDEKRELDARQVELFEAAAASHGRAAAKAGSA